MALAQGDKELEELRSKRLAELQAGGGQQESEEKSRREEMHNMILSQILSQDARARLNSIALVKPEKAKLIEANLLRMAQTGQIAEKLSESQLIGLLEQFNSQQGKSTKVKFQRRAIDSDDDDT